MSLRLIDFVDFFFRQLEFAAGDAQGEHELLLGGFSLGAFVLQVAVVQTADEQANRDCCERGPADERLRD